MVLLNIFSSFQYIVLISVILTKNRLTKILQRTWDKWFLGKDFEHPLTKYSINEMKLL